MQHPDVADYSGGPHWTSVAGHDRRMAVHGMVDEPQAVMVVDLGPEGGLDQAAVEVGLVGVGGLVHEILDHDHLPGEPPGLDRARVPPGRARPDQLRPLRVDGLALDRN